MTSQPDLFTVLPERLPAFQRGSSTSKQAARKVAKRTPNQRAKVEAEIQACGSYGATRRELEVITGLLTQSLCGRISELKGEGSIYATARVRDGGEVLVHREFYGR